MKRVAAVCLSLLALGAAAPVAPAQAPQDENARYELANGCFGLRSEQANALVATDAGPFRLQATRLGHYLLYGRDRTFLAAGSGDALPLLGGSQTPVEPAQSPDGNADWRVDVVGGAFRLTLPASGKVMAYENGRLVVVEPERAGDNARFTFEPADGCAVYPEIEVSASGTPLRGPTFYGETSGTVDAHMHMMAFEFIGGSVHCGRPWHPYGVASALVDCPDHATGVAPLETGLGGKERHDPVGWPTFRDWPDNQSLTHESAYYKWLERAWMGGLRIYTNLLVDNGVLCEVYPLKRNSCDEMDSVRLQARRLRELEDYIDAQNGGPGKGWFRIVTDPFEARRVINDGKLAVIMGIEVSRLFDCTETNYRPECTKEQIDRQLDEVHDLGVRQMELINKFDNALGGVAGDAGDTGVVVNNGNKYETDHYWDMRTCDGPEHAHDREQHTSGQHNTDELIGNGLAQFLPPGETPLYGPPPHCNAYGLTGLGEHLVRRMIDKGMLIDPDHLSVRARNELLNVVESRDYSGVLSSHSWSTPDSFPRIYRLGGFITPYAGDSTAFVEKWRKTKKLRDRRFYWGFGYGADMNGFGSQGDPRGADVPNPVTYPFKGMDGAVTFDKQRSGERVYDINVDGVDHYGLYPDWIEDLRKQAGDQIVNDMRRGAEAYLQMWERAVGVPASRCRSPHLTFTRRGLGPSLLLGSGPEQLLRSASQPRSRVNRTWRWCVSGRGRQGKTVAAVMTKAGRLALVASDASAPRAPFVHEAKGVGAGAPAKRVRRKTRPFGKGIRVRRAGSGGRKFVYVIRRKRVAAVAIATRGASKSPRRLRRHLRLSGLP